MKLLYVKALVLWVVMSYSNVVAYHCFGGPGPCCLLAFYLLIFSFEKYKHNCGINI